MLGCSFRRYDFDVEHRMGEKAPSARIFAEWHNVERFDICSVHHLQFFDFSGSPDWIKTTTNRLLLVLFPPEFAHYSGLALNNGYSWLINVIAHSEFVVCASMTFQHAASKGFSKTFKSDTC